MTNHDIRDLDLDQQRDMFGGDGVGSAVVDGLRELADNAATAWRVLVQHLTE